jgi:hypothetical protein
MGSIVPWGESISRKRKKKLMRSHSGMAYNKAAGSGQRGTPADDGKTGQRITRILNIHEGVTEGSTELE